MTFSLTTPTVNIEQTRGVDGAANAKFVVFSTFQVLGRGKLVAKGSLWTLLISRSLQPRLAVWVLEHDRVSLRISVCR